MSPRGIGFKVFPFLVASIIATSLLLTKSQALTCNETGTIVSPSTLPTPPDSYQVEVEANIIDKGYTTQAKYFYSYPNNAASIMVFSQGADNRYIFNYATDEIFTISGTDCSVNQLTTSHDIYSTWLLGNYRLSDGQLHVQRSQWFTNFTYGTDYGPNYIENTTVRGVPVDHWQSCGKWQPNRSMMVDYYFAKNWNSASTYPRVPVRIEIMADKQLPNGSMYILHHVYDFFNFKAEAIGSQTIFQTPVGVICPGRKNTKTVPKLPQRFYVRNEIIYEGSSVVTYEDVGITCLTNIDKVWYDAAFKYYRRDYRPLTATYPTFSYNPLTEIHDYYIGARYVIDKGQGNCTTLPLSNASNDVRAESINGSYVIQLRNPLQLFNLDWNYTYIGQVSERGVLCDVFITMRSDLLVFDMMANSNTTITFYFLAPEWDSYDNSVIQAGGYGTPVKMILQDDVGLSVTYNYVDFALMPMLETYDISTCYPEAHALKFQVRFQGVFQQQQQVSIPYMKDAAHMAFVQQMGVAFLRIQHLNVDYDDAYTYISATLLDKTPPTAQFEYIPGKVIEKQDDSIVYNIYTPFECAGFCVNNQAFICNSFDFCSDDHTCRLSRAHIGDGKAVVKSSSTCDHFSRSVNGVRDEPSIQDAFNQMRMKIYNKTLSLPLNMGQHMTAVDISVNFGWLTTNVKLPTLSESFHYRIEGTVPALTYAYEGEVWYDKTFQLIRYDTHYTGPVTPFPSTNPLTIIDDFSTGLQYVVDKVNKNCTMQAIPRTDFAAILTPQGLQNSTWSLRMKTPYELLHIDNTYKFVGQQTVRGMLCNVFESLRTDYSAPGVDGNYQSVFKYFFLAKDWYEVSEEYGGARSQPVRLEITIVQIGMFIEFNMFDFNTDRPDVSVYDIHECFNATNQQTFQITFPGPYHPYLDTQVNMFRDEVIFAMARITTLPPLRFQRTRVDYDNTNIYVTTTMVGNAAIPHYFTYIINGNVVEHADKVVSSQGIDTAQHCAQMCYAGFVNLTCNSFYFCSTQKECLFSGQNAPSLDGPKPNIVPGCESYSRTVTSKDAAPLTDLEAFTLLKNNVYRGQLKITIPGPGYLEPYTYPATVVRTDIIQPGTHSKQNEAMQHFISFKNNSKTEAFDSSLNYISLDDCALACTSILDFQCQGFTYCDGVFTCALIKTRPEQLASSGVQQTDSCYIYQRNYLDDYISTPGTVSMTTAGSTVSSVTSSNDCARQCTQTKSLTCRSFEFCPSAKQCLLFSGWTVGNASTGASTACEQYKRSFLADFQPVNGGTFVFTTAVQFLGISVTQCAQMCVEQQRTNCHGFYFCDKVSACHLTSVQPGQPQVRMDQSSHAVFCNYYTRLGINSTTLSSVTSTTSQMTSSSTQRTKLSPKPSSVSTSVATSSSSSTSGSIARSSSTSPMTHSITTRHTTGVVSSSNTASSSTSPCIGTPQKQTGDSNKVKSGTVVGVAFATFIIGLVIGAVAFFIFNRFRSKPNDEMEMHITKHDH